MANKVAYINFKIKLEK